MRILSRPTLIAFWTRHKSAQQVLQAWHSEVQRASWKSPSDVRAAYHTASILPGDRVVFRLGGNNYRLVVHIRYDKGICYIRFVGTHAEYDKINANTI